ncbi:MAG: hypothetical protein R6U95_01305 [Bacteroidales bacterium]
MQKNPISQKKLRTEHSQLSIFHSTITFIQVIKKRDTDITTYCFEYDYTKEAKAHTTIITS